MTSIDLDDDLIVFTIDSFDDDEYCSRSKSDPLTSETTPIDRISTTSTVKSSSAKMSDITDLINSTEFNDKQESFELMSQNLLSCLRAHSLKTDQHDYEEPKQETEEQFLKYGSKQLSPSDYLTRTSLYNRPVAFEKDSRLWARSLLDNFKKSNQNTKSKPSSTSVNFAYYLPIVKKSSSFDRHVQYVEHLNECNDYPAYLEYLRENRSELLYTLTDSIDVIDGLIGTVV